MPNFEKESILNFKKTKDSLIKNSFAKFLVIGGGISSLINSLIPNPFTSLLESLAIGTSAYIVSQSLKSDKDIKSMSDSELNRHMTKGAFLLVGGSIISGLVNTLPSPIAHLANYPTSILMLSGAVGIGEAGYQKYKKSKL